MEVIKVTRYEQMASGRNYCALVSSAGKQTTDFGRTEEEAIDNAKMRLSGKKK